jgi:hypothetical protein
MPDLVMLQSILLYRVEQERQTACSSEAELQTLKQQELKQLTQAFSQCFPLD